MPDSLFAQIDTYIDEHIDQTIDELAHLCAQPSISAQGKGLQECAELVAAMLRARGVPTELMIIPGAHHFSITRSLADPEGVLPKAIRRQIGV